MLAIQSGIAKYQYLYTQGTVAFQTVSHFIDSPGGLESFPMDGEVSRLDMHPKGYQSRFDTMHPSLAQLTKRKLYKPLGQSSHKTGLIAPYEMIKRAIRFLSFWRFFTRNPNLYRSFRVFLCLRCHHIFMHVFHVVRLRIIKI